MTPADRGRQVEFREACKVGTTKCSYGRPVARGWKVALGAMSIIEWCLLGFCAFMAMILLVRAIAGSSKRPSAPADGHRLPRTYKPPHLRRKRR